VKVGPASGPTFTYGPIAYTRRRYGSGGARGSGGHGERPLASVMRPFRGTYALMER
jgi:hypothetical protein